MANRMVLMSKLFDTSSIARAALFQLFAKFANVLVQLVITMVLSRIIAPDQYGTVAVLTVFTGFFSIMSDIGISSAVIQFRDLSEEDHRHLFTFSIILGIGLAACFYGVCCLIAVVYTERTYYSLGAILTLSVVFNSMNMVPNGLLLKEKRFDLVGIRLVVCTCLVGVLTIAMALMGMGCYALVLNSVMTALFVLAWNLAHLKLKPLLGDFRPTLKKIWHYSMFQFGHECMGYFARNIDSLLVGKFFGASALGYYNKAYTLYGYPESYLISSITSTLRPFFAEHQDDSDAMYGRALKVAKTVSLLAGCCTCVLSVCASEIIVVLFGEQWLPAGPLLQILALSIYAQSMNGVLAPIMGAKGRTDLLMLSTTVNSILTIVTVVVGSMLGSVHALAVAVAIAYNVEVFVPLYFAIKKCLGKSLIAYIKHFVTEVFTVVTVVAAGLFLPFGVLPLVLRLVAELAFSVCGYVLLTVLMGQSSYIKDVAKSLRG